MIRSEERLRVGTETRETGRARPRKYVVTEHVQITVPVSREEVRVVQSVSGEVGKERIAAEGVADEDRRRR